MTEEEYQARLAEYEAEADRLAAAERVLVKESHVEESRRQALVAQYDRDLEARNQSGIEAYKAAFQEWHDRSIALTAKLSAIRADFDALKRPRRLVRDGHNGWGCVEL